MKKTNKKGFTIVELVIVIAVIAILAAVLIPTFGGVVDNAKNSAVIQEARNAYTTYVAENATKDTVVSNFLYKDGGKIVVIKEGNLYTVNGEVKVYAAADEAEALKVFANGTETYEATTATSTSEKLFIVTEKVDAGT